MDRSRAMVHADSTGTLTFLIEASFPLDFSLPIYPDAHGSVAHCRLSVCQSEANLKRKKKFRSLVDETWGN